MIMLTLTRGYFAKIDDEDFDYLNQFFWFLDSYGYASSTYKRRNILMHREILQINGITIPKGYEIDHINRNKTDNQKFNLRIVDRSFNQHNSGLSCSNKSGTKGVYFDRLKNMWRVEIRVHGIRIHLGSFKNKEEAIKVRKEAELKYFPEIYVRQQMEKNQGGPSEGDNKA